MDQGFRVNTISPHKRFQPFTRKRACAYVRVSTEHIKQLDSLQNQTEYYERLIRNHPDYIFCGIYSDAGVSGAKQNRPGFNAMMKAARNGEIDIIFTKSISRFARNTLLVLESVRELRSLGVGVLFEEQQLNTLTADGEFMLTVLASIAEEERRSVCENVRWSTRAALKQGKAQFPRLLGYTKGATIIPDEAKVVRYIYRRYLEGVSGYKIARELNEDGIPTLSGYPWVSHIVLSVISNEKYKGDVLLLKSYIADDGRQHRNHGEIERYYVHNHHPAIVSKKDWDAAQRIREKKKPKTYLFTSLLHCPYCGRSLIRVQPISGQVKWICATYMQKGKSACQGIKVPEKILMELAPITQPMIVEEELYADQTKTHTQTRYYLKPTQADRRERC